VDAVNARKVDFVEVVVVDERQRYQSKRNSVRLQNAGQKMEAKILRAFYHTGSGRNNRLRKMGQRMAETKQPASAKRPR
jgi:hypothetical protein